MDRVFKIHCSQIGCIMGRMGLTEIQEARLTELNKRFDGHGLPLTANMVKEREELLERFNNPELPATAKTYLHQWYAGDEIELDNKYVNKGNYVESDLIDFMASKLGLGFAEKNIETKEDDYLIGTCDVDPPEFIVDVKAMWNNTTLHQNIEKITPDYEWQLRGYMRLWNKQTAILFYGLLDTPAEVNYDREVSYSHIPENERWIAYKVERDLAIENQIIERVKLCRTYLEGHDKLVKSRLGKLFATA